MTLDEDKTRDSGGFIVGINLYYYIQNNQSIK